MTSFQIRQIPLKKYWKASTIRKIKTFSESALSWRIFIKVWIYLSVKIVQHEELCTVFDIIHNYSFTVTFTYVISIINSDSEIMLTSVEGHPTFLNISTLKIRDASWPLPRKRVCGLIAIYWSKFSSNILSLICDILNQLFSSEWSLQK